MEIPSTESDNYINHPRELRDCSVIFSTNGTRFTVSVSYNYGRNRARFIPFDVNEGQFNELLSYVEMNELYRADMLNYIRTMLNQDQAAS